MPLSFGRIVLAVTFTFVLGISCGNNGSARYWGCATPMLEGAVEVIVAAELDGVSVIEVLLEPDAETPFVS